MELLTLYYNIFNEMLKKKAILRAKSIKILYHLWLLLAKLLRLLISILPPLYQVIIWEIAVLPYLYQFWNTLQAKLAHKDFHTASIKAKKLGLFKLKDNDKETKKPRAKKLSESWKNIKKVFYYKKLLYVLKIIYSKLINMYHNNLWAGYFWIKKT